MTTRQDALYTNSTLAMNPRTGQVEWYFQHAPAETLGLDIVCVNPGDTPSPSARMTHWVVAQRRPGREPRRHGSEAQARPPALGTLNEGRGVNPGDTRPAVVGFVDDDRSTKAGA